MIRLLIIFCAAFTALDIITGNNAITIPLFRQKTPRQNIINTPNIKQHAIWLDWLKPKPKPFNRTNDTIPLLRFLDTEFYGIVNVGSPGQAMKVIFDTAWSSSWVISKDCPTRTVGCWFHNKYHHEKSSTYRENRTPFNANEGTYNLTGYYSIDNITIGHSTVNQTFIEMTSIPYWYIFTKADGVIGLGLKFNDLNPLFYNVLQQTNITKAVFSIYLNRDKSSNKGGSITLGAIDEKHVHVTNKTKDPIIYTPINIESGLWEFNLDRVLVLDGNKSYPICTTGCKGLADTSSNSVITSQSYLKVINEKIGARPFAFDRFEVDCDKVNKLPFIQFAISNTNFNLTGNDYIQKLSVGPFTVCVSSLTAASTVSEQDRWIMGGAFLSKFFSIYDIANKKIGFVRAA